MLSMIIGCVVVIGFSLRDILQKHTAPHYHNSLQAGAIPAIFTTIMIVICFISPMFNSLWHPNYIHYNLEILGISNVLKHSAPSHIFLWMALLIGILKGVVVFTLNSGARSLDLSAVSGSAYLAFVSLAIGAFLNHIFFGEDVLLLPIILTAGLALVFYIKGPGNKIIKDGKIWTLLLCIFSLAFLICIDYVGIASSNWFFHLAVSNFSALILFMWLILIKKIKSFNFLSNKLILCSGIVYALMEFTFVYSFSVLGVSLAFLLGMSSYLPTMLYGSLKYQEGRWYVQSFFAIVAIFCIFLSAYKIDFINMIMQNL